MTKSTPQRVNILNTAAELIVGQRQEDYGTPQENFQRFADLTNIIIKKNLETNTPLSARQMADIMVLLKMSRTVNTPTEDSYIDIAGYAGIAGELANPDSKEKTASTGVGSAVDYFNTLLSEDEIKQTAARMVREGGEAL